MAKTIIKYCIPRIRCAYKKRRLGRGKRSRATYL